MRTTVEVSKNTFYNWLKDLQPGRKLLIYKIKNIQNTRNKSYFVPKITIELEKMGYKVSRTLVAKMMCKQGRSNCLPPKFVVTRDSGQKAPIAENILNRKFQGNEKGTVWLSGISYSRVNSGWIYLTTVIDLVEENNQFVCM